MSILLIGLILQAPVKGGQWLPNTAVRRRLSSVQSREIALVRVVIGQTNVAVPASVTFNRRAGIEVWKMALDRSIHRRDRWDPSLRLGPKSKQDSVRLVTKGGKEFSFPLFGPDEMTNYWGPEVEGLYQKAWKQLQEAMRI